MACDEVVHVQTLIARGANTEIATTDYMRRPLHMAASQCSKGCVSHQAGAKLDTKEYQGLTPLDLVFQQGEREYD